MGRLGDMNKRIAELAGAVDEGFSGGGLDAFGEILRPRSEPVTLSDSAVASLHESTERVTEAAESVSKSLNAAVKQASKANTDHLKASVKALNQIAERQDAELRAIMNQVREVSQSNPALIDALIAALKDLKPARPEPIQFDIQRDGNGYMKTVIATPVPHGTRKAPPEALETYS